MWGDDDDQLQSKQQLACYFSHWDEKPAAYLALLLCLVVWRSCNLNRCSLRDLDSGIAQLTWQQHTHHDGWIIYYVYSLYWKEKKKREREREIWNRKDFPDVWCLFISLNRQCYFESHIPHLHQLQMNLVFLPFFNHHYCKPLISLFSFRCHHWLVESCWNEDHGQCFFSCERQKKSWRFSLSYSQVRCLYSWWHLFQIKKSIRN